MFTFQAAARNRAIDQGHAHRKDLRAAALLGALLLVGIAVNALIIIADTHKRQSAAEGCIDLACEVGAIRSSKE